MLSGNNLDKYRFPKTLGESMRIVGMPMDEFLLSIPVLLISVLFGYAMTGLILGAFSWIGLRRLKSGKGSMWLYNLLYWFLPAEIFQLVYKVIPNSSFRQWIK